MPKTKIDKKRCKGCRLCIICCPKGLLTEDKKLNNRGVFAAVVKDEKGECTGCKFCALICPEVCITISKK